MVDLPDGLPAEELIDACLAKTLAYLCSAIGYAEIMTTMVKVVVASLQQELCEQPAHETVVEKRVRGANGRATILRTIDANSSTFATDLQSVFRKNVAKARRANKRLIGVSDVAIPKS